VHADACDLARLAAHHDCDTLPGMLRPTPAILFGLAVFSTTPSATAAVPDITFERYRLPNGLDVILHVERRMPIVHTEVWYKVGSKDEVTGKTGFAHLFEHMMFQGTKHIPEDAFFKYLAQAGASARNGSTSTDRTNYFETLPASQLELGLWLESSRMGFLMDRDGNPERVPMPSRDASLPAEPAGSARDRNGNPERVPMPSRGASLPAEPAGSARDRPSSFSESFANQRDVVKNERRQRVENVPLGGVARVEMEALYPPGHPYRHEVVGSMEDLDSASEAELKDFYNRYYAPGNAVLLVAGDIDVAVTKGLIEKYFGPIAAGEPIQRVPVPAMPPSLSEKRIDMEAKINLPRGQMSWHTVPVFAPGDAELDVIANILGDGKSSRLHQRLVFDLKIAQAVSVNHGSRVLGGQFQIAYSAMQGHTLAEIEKVIDEELDKLRSQPPTTEEIERAKNQIRTDLLKGMEPLAGLATRLLYYDVFAGDPDYLRHDLERYEQATPQSLMSWAQRILARNDRVLVDVEPNPKAPIMGRLRYATTATTKKSPAVDAAASAKVPATAFASRSTPDAPFRSKLPAPGEKRAFKIPPVKRLRLRNGLAVILAESHKLPLVSVNLVLKTGSSANPKDRAGLASLTANMLDEGTKKRTASEIAKEIAQLGASLSTYATWDASSVSLSTMSENLDRALPVWADVLLNPVFGEEDFKRVVDNLQSSLAQRKDYPSVVAAQVFARSLWGDSHPFAWPDTGTPTSIAALGRADVKRFYDTNFAPNNAVLVVSGDITEKQIHSQIEPLLASWKVKKIPATRLPKTSAPEKVVVVLVDKAGAPQSSIRIGLPGIERKNPDYYRALVTNQILGGTFHRLTMNLRETKGWTYGISSQFDARKQGGPWIVSGELVAAHTADAALEVIKEIEKLRTEDVTDKELAEVKDEIIGAFPARFATADQLASQMAGLSVYDLPPNELETFAKKIAAVDKAQVRKTAQKYFRPDNLLVVVVGDRASTESALRRIAEVERRDLDGARIEPAK
jgi:zinc protease